MKDPDIGADRVANLTAIERARLEAQLNEVRGAALHPERLPTQAAKPPPYNRTPEGQADLDAAHKTFSLLVDLVEAPSRPPMIVRGVDLVSISYSGVRLDFRPMRGRGADPIWHVQAPGHKGGAWDPGPNAPQVSTGFAALAAGIKTAESLARTAHDKRRSGRWEALVELLHEGARYASPAQRGAV